MDMLEMCGMPAIAVLCYGGIELVKRTVGQNGTLKRAYPTISAVLGAVLGVLAFWGEPELMVTDSPLSSALVGMVSGLSATGGNEMLRRILQPPTVKAPRYYITGDKHRHFNRLIQFCRAQRLERQDVIVILGDACVNYYGDDRDGALKRRLARLPVTLFFVQGNKENRPQNIATYGIRSFGGGTVYYEPQYPNLFFAKDGELYDLGGKEFLVIGGAHSVDKLRCLGEGLPFFADEEPDEATKARVEERLAARGWRVFGFLTHTCPVSYLPTEMFMSVRQATSANTELSVEGSGEDTQDTEEDFYPLDVDRTTEEWLETIRQRTDFSLWYCGHYHVDKALGKLRMMHKEILPLETGDGNET